MGPSSPLKDPSSARPNSPPSPETHGGPEPHLRTLEGSKRIEHVARWSDWDRQEEGPYYYVTTGDKKYLYTLHQSIVEHLTPAVKDLEKVRVKGAETVISEQ